VIPLPNAGAPSAAVEFVKFGLNPVPGLYAIIPLANCACEFNRIKDKPAIDNTDNSFFILIFQLCLPNRSADGFCLRDQSEVEGIAPGERTTPQSGGGARVAPALQNKKPSNPAKSENEGIQEIPARTRDTGWPHPSLCGEVGPAERDHDERIQTGILTSGFTSLPPSRLTNSSVAFGSS
jgi:hypothetical protein